MELSSIQGGEADALNTAIIDFDFPAGHTLTSELGWMPIPEPTTILLVGLATAGILFRPRRRKIPIGQ